MAPRLARLLLAAMTSMRQTRGTKTARTAVFGCCCLITLLVLSIPLASLASKSREHHPRRHQHEHRASQDRKQDEQVSAAAAAAVSIDALDETKCGEANFQPWQRKQSAFGCATTGRNNSQQHALSHAQRSNKAGRGPFELPHAGEFPSLVRILFEGGHRLSDVYAAFDHCSGILIHEDVVLTTAIDCVRHSWQLTFPRPKRIIFAADSKHVKKPENSTKDGAPPPSVLRSGKKWCSYKRLPADERGDTAPRPDDLAVILLDKPVKYVPGKIGPACLRIGGGGGSSEGGQQPSSTSTCVLAAQCVSESAQADDLLTIMAVRRGTCSASGGGGGGGGENQTMIPHEMCYRPQNAGAGRCRAKPGAPVICYDKCSASQPDKVRAYAVGLLSQNGKSTKVDHDLISVIDLHKSRARLMELMRALRQEDDKNVASTISCDLMPTWV